MPIDSINRQRYVNPAYTAGGGEAAPLGPDMEGDYTTYHESLSRAAAVLHGTGVAVGFAVAATADHLGVTVGAGIAVAASGRLVILSDTGPALVGDVDTPVVLPATVQLPAADGWYALTARPVLVPQDGLRCGRFAVGVRLRVTAAPGTPDPDAVLLALVHMTGGKVTTIADSTPAVAGISVTRIGYNVLRSQIDAVHNQLDAAKAVLALKSDLAAHTGNMANPHGTTAAQVGALPITGGAITGGLKVGGRLDFGQEAPPDPFDHGRLLFSERGTAVFNRDGKRVASLTTSERAVILGPGGITAGSGRLIVSHPSGADGVRAFIGARGGRIEVCDASGIVRAALDASGVKPFMMPHPADPTKQIVYAAVEGPEAAAYIRGRAMLVGGAATIAYPEHFALVVNPDTVTVTLTPCSAVSKGLAVTTTDATGFQVAELGEGKGSYEFDYVVMGVRKGYEDYRPVVATGETHFGELAETEETQQAS